MSKCPLGNTEHTQAAWALCAVIHEEARLSWVVGLSSGTNRVGTLYSSRVVGAYAYHFWMAAMTPIRRVSGNQYLHHKSDAYRDAVRRKIAAYHRHIQLGLIAQGLLQILSARTPQRVWQSFGSWIRTVRPGLAPSEQVTAIALRNTLPEFLATAAKTSILVKFIRDRIDLSRSEGTSLAA